MLVKVLTIEELKQDFDISFRNNCGDKVTKFSDLSVINGFSYSISKLVQKINKNAAQIEAKLFPEYANGTALDDIANRDGVPSRTSSTSSSIVLLFKADSGTVYVSGTQIKTASGIIFQTNSELIIDSNGYGFILAESTTKGEQTNVLPNSVTIFVGTSPVGHSSVTNLVKAVGGSDEESDYNFRKRLINAQFILSRNTEAYYETLIYNINNNLLRIKTKASSSLINSFTVILVKNSLADFNSTEINDIKTGIKDNLPLSDYNNLKINISNIDWTYIDVYVPIKKKAGYVLKDMLIEMQIACQDYLNLNTWPFGQKVNWETIYELCNNIDGVQDIVDVSFTPRTDIIVGEDSLPRFRSFTLYDVDVDETEGEAFSNSFFIHDNREDRIYSQIIS